MDIPHFEKEFRHFSEVVYPRYGDSHFVSFRDGAARGWESYKPKLREQALQILDVPSWQLEMIGTGEILDRAISAIEIRDNNLVSWEGRYGPASAAHSALKDAQQNGSRRKKFEHWFWSAFRQIEDPDDLFEQLRSLAGNGYPLAAYLFFLIDIERFAPIAPETFDAAFRRLGISLVTSGQCSWENYAQYNEAINAVRDRLILKPGLADASHIDAHSFLWMMVRMEEDTTNGKKSSGPVRYAPAKTRSIVEMALNASSAAGQSGKQSMHVNKIKDMFHSREELEKIIERLINEQAELCALTSLPLQWRGEAEEPSMLASLDRIDSNGHYIDGNLQVVCRFVNQWKSDSPDGEFRRLLGIVRGVMSTQSDEN
jgi:hypothetical protein